MCTACACYLGRHAHTHTTHGANYKYLRACTQERHSRVSHWLLVHLIDGSAASASAACSVHTLCCLVHCYNNTTVIAEALNDKNQHSLSGRAPLSTSYIQYIQTHFPMVSFHSQLGFCIIHCIASTVLLYHHLFQ